MTDDLFSHAAAATGKELAIQGAQRAADHADRVSDGWSDRALACLLDYGARAGEFMIEDVAAHAAAHGLDAPPDNRAWGAVVLAAKRLGRIEHVRYSKVKTRHCHAGPRSVWKTL